MNKKVAFVFILGAASTAAIVLAASLFAKPSQTNKPENAHVELISPPPVSDVKAVRVVSPSQSAAPMEFSAPAAPNKSSAVSQESPQFLSMISPEPDAHSVVYPVKPGDNLTTIARRHGVTVDLLRKTNRLPSDKLLAGQKLKIPNYKLSVFVDKSENTLVLKGDSEILKTYVVSTGSNNSTPVGTFKITHKLIDPTWYKSGAVIPSGDKENQLGTRWMGFDLQGYGIHGTIEPETLGRQVTAGCVRMRNEEVEELYALVPSGTEVTVTD